MDLTEDRSYRITVRGGLLGPDRPHTYTPAKYVGYRWWAGWTHSPNTSNDLYAHWFVVPKPDEPERMMMLPVFPRDLLQAEPI